MSNRVILFACLVALCTACERKPRSAKVKHHQAAVPSEHDGGGSLPHGFRCPDGTRLYEAFGGAKPPSEDLDRTSTEYSCLDGLSRHRGRLIVVADSGILLAERFYNDAGELHGPSRWWHWNGVLATEGEYAEGEPHGRAQYWGESGSLWQSSEYARGKRHGEFRIWYPNGQLWSSGSYVDGEKHGRWTYWHENGAKWKEGTYLAGARESDWRFWNERGEPATEESASGIDAN